MNCNGRRLNIFLGIYLIILFLQFMACQPNDNEIIDKNMELQGNLYEVFQRRLEKFNNEMAFFDENKKGGINFSQGKRATVRQCLYEEFKKRLERINKELSLDEEKVFNRIGRTTLSSNLQNDRSSIKNKLDDDPYTPIKEDLYEASRKRLDKIGSELHLKERCNKQRNNRSPFEETISESNAFSKLHIGPTLYQNSNEFINNANDYEEFDNDKLYGGTAKSGLYEVKNFNRNTKSKWSNLRRRQANISKSNVNSETSLTLANEMGTSYPAVLARPSESNPGTANRVTSTNLLSTMAQKLNTSPLELAKKVAKTELNNPDSFKNDPQLSQILQKYISNTVQINTNQRKSKQTPVIDTSLTQESPPPTSSALNQPFKRQPTAQLLLQPQTQCLPQPLLQTQNLSAASTQVKPQFQAQQPLTQYATPQQAQIQLTTQPQLLPTQYGPQFKTTNAVLSQSSSLESSNNNTETSILQNSTICAAPSNISSILEKVLSNLERIHEEKNKSSDENLHPEGAPCTLRGTWSSYVVGLHFDISPKNETKCDTYSEPVDLLIEVNDTCPPKRHDIIDAEWKFIGTAMKLIGGPFYLISQNRSESVLATFAGYCRTCGGIDTIFGSWTFVFPSKDCQDVSVSIDTKRDILRRSDLEEKRDERLKEMAEKQTCGKKRL